MLGQQALLLGRGIQAIAKPSQHARGSGSEGWE